MSVTTPTRIKGTETNVLMVVVSWDAGEQVPEGYVDMQSVIHNGCSTWDRDIYKALEKRTMSDNVPMIGVGYIWHPEYKGQRLTEANGSYAIYDLLIGNRWD